MVPVAEPCRRSAVEFSPPAQKPDVFFQTWFQVCLFVNSMNLIDRYFFTGVSCRRGCSAVLRQGRRRHVGELGRWNGGVSHGILIGGHHAIWTTVFMRTVLMHMGIQKNQGWPWVKQTMCFIMFSIRCGAICFCKHWFSGVRGFHRRKQTQSRNVLARVSKHVDMIWFARSLPHYVSHPFLKEHNERIKLDPARRRHETSQFQNCQMNARAFLPMMSGRLGSRGHVHGNRMPIHPSECFHVVHVYIYIYAVFPSPNEYISVKAYGCRVLPMCFWRSNPKTHIQLGS